MNFVFLYFFFTGIISFLIVHILTFISKNKSSNWIKIFLLSIGFYALGASMEIIHKDYSSTLFWFKFGYIGGAFYFSSLVLSVLEYENKKINNFLKNLLIFYSLIFMAIAFYDINLIFEDLKFVKTNFTSIISFKPTIIYWMKSVYEIIIGTFGIIVFLKAFFNSDKHRKKKLALFLYWEIALFVIGILNVILNNEATHTLVAFVTSFPVYIIIYTSYDYTSNSAESIFLDKVFQNSPMEIIVLDKAFIIVEENKASINSFGELCGKSISNLSIDVYNCINKFLKQIKGITLGENTYNISVYEYKRKGKTIGFILNFSDITELKNAKNRLTHINKELLKLNEEKEKLILSVSHDLRTPLNGIIGMTQLLQTNEIYNKTYVDTINDTSQYMLKLLNEILLSRKDEIRRNFNIKELFNELSYSFKKSSEEKGLYFFSDLSIQIPEILFGDVGKLKQILFNIIDNAIKYTDKGGIIVKVSVINMNTNNIKLLFDIEDTGIGLEDVNKIDLFYPENFAVDSFGISLYNSKKIIDSLGGILCIESKKYIGTSIKIELSFELTEETEKNEIFEPLNKNLILISDLKILNKFLMSIFQDLGLDYYSVDSVAEFKEFREYIGGENNFILILDRIYNAEEESFVNDLDSLVLLTTEIANLEQNVETIDINDISKEIILNSLGINKNHDKNANIKTNKKVFPKYENVNILILEDNPVNIIYLQEIFKMINVEYSTAESVKEAEELLKNKTYDLIFSDIFLEESTSFEFISSLKNSIHNKMKKIAVTASVTEEMKKKCLNIGFDEFIEKPYEINDILSLLNLYFGNQQKKREKSVNFEIGIEYYQIFVRDIDYELQKLEESILNSIWEETKKVAHKIKGGASTLREAVLVENLINIENCAKNMDKQNIEKEFLNLKENINDLKERINR